MQRALWDMVTPDLRKVAVRVEDNHIRARFVYDRPITEFLTELVGEIETEVVADFFPELLTDFSVEYIPKELPRKFDEGWRSIYLRREQVDPEP